ncbi:MAG: 16S rRNA (adenine(1518)-N(6)/adenine(1519)-N(6))-dimethyltransferase RsmA [Bacteroidales bacterium]|nr:16S rRNA (adenine(1518)-N(6)/adenine(1519)-N(6))-dimethyltransferase RsmA [Bacteroidales bacterium]MDP2237172.1 16S rRNA (adenine(1518)-N(6)/adenine(1519)-N(6))-dimethyltransferase RsmA [Bacteroidales bacterium]
MVRPKKHLGQHFLTDQNIARKIVDTLSGTIPKVLEIGPGTGVLTSFLLPRYGENLFLIEIDEESTNYLKELFPSLSDRIFLEDFLKADLQQFGPEPVAIIGNFPYNISSQIFFQILDHRNMVREVVCMIQKEVAERIATPPGSKTYGILSVLLQAWYDISYCFTVGENVFNPPPKVKSAVIKLQRNNTTDLGCNPELFHQIVKQAFNQRRKTLRNGLRSRLHTDIITHEIFNKRAEQLHVKDFVFITQLIENQNTAPAS